MGGIISAITGSGASKAASAQAAASQAAIETQKESSAEAVAVQREALAQQRSMFDEAMANGKPFITAGQQALTKYQDLLYGNGTDQTAALEATPGYQFQMEEGTKALERGAAARGGALSGSESKALTRFGQGLASTQFNTFMDRIGALGTQGANVAVNQGSAAVNAGGNAVAGANGIASNILTTGQNVGSLQTSIGAAQASGYLGQQQAGQNLINMGMQAAGMFFSDERIKENITKTGTKNGHNLYRFNYKGAPCRRYEGVLAQEVQRKRPDAVHQVGALKAVDYKKIGVEMRAV